MKSMPVLLSSPIFWALISVFAASAVLIINDYFHNPFKHPKIRYGIDLSGKRQPSYEECIDEWLIRIGGHGRAVIDVYNGRLKGWESECENCINHTRFWKKHKISLLNDI